MATGENNLASVVTPDPDGRDSAPYGETALQPGREPRDTKLLLQSPEPPDCHTGYGWEEEELVLQQSADARGGDASPKAPSYRFEKLIATGGMGEVWRATQTNLCRIVALKKLKPGTSLQQSEQELLFHQEAVIMAQLDHPNIVPIYDCGEDKAHAPLISMKLVSGTAWDSLIIAELAALPYRDYLAKQLMRCIDDVPGTR